jgi:hypothetical protein
MKESNSANANEIKANLNEMTAHTREFLASVKKSPKSVTSLPLGDCLGSLAIVFNVGCPSYSTSSEALLNLQS